MCLKYKCEFCSKEINISKLRLHLNKNHVNDFLSILELTKYVINKKDGISYEMLEYIINEYEYISTLQIELKYNFNFRQYITGLGLKHKTISDSNKLVSTIEKRKITTYNKFGVDNASKCDIIKEKKKKTFLKHYGVDNIWKTIGYRDYWESIIKAKYGKFCLADLYGNENYFGWKTTSDIDKTKRINKLTKCYKLWYNNLSSEELLNLNRLKTNKIIEIVRSNLEKRIERILNENNIYNKPQYWIAQKSYDFYLGDKIILEINGTYWHCDNRFYKPNDLIKFGSKTYLVSEVWEKDQYKKTIAEKYTYQVFYMWEHDINNMSDNEILIHIQNLIYENKKYYKN